MIEKTFLNSDLNRESKSMLSVPHFASFHKSRIETHSRLYTVYSLTPRQDV